MRLKSANENEDNQSELVWHGDEAFVRRKKDSGWV